MENFSKLSQEFLNVDVTTKVELETMIDAIYNKVGWVGGCAVSVCVCVRRARACGE
jgi:hypothetical protein